MQSLPPSVDSPLAWCRRRSAAALATAGLISGLVYLAFVLLFLLPLYGAAPRPFDVEQIAAGRHWMGAAWLAGVVVLYAAFGVAVLTVERVPGALAMRLIVGFGVVFGLILVWLYPVTATDLFQYVLRARVWVVHGANPMAVPPSVFAGDPLLPFAGEWQDIVSPYGPAWELLAAGVARLGFTGAVSGALAYKGVAMLAYLACIWLLHRIACPAVPPTSSSGRVTGGGGYARSLLLFAWNPLVLVQGVGNGHNDVIMLVWLLLAVYVWQRRRSSALTAVTGGLLAGAAITLAVLTKAAAGLLGLLLVVAIVRDQPGWRRFAVLAGLAGVGAAVAALAYLPFWPPWQSIAGVLDEMANRYTYTIAATLRLGLREWLPPAVARDIPRLIGQLLFVVVLGWMAAQLWRRRLDLVSAGFLAYFTYLVAGASYRIWYPLWLAPLAALSLSAAVRWRTILLCLTSELSVIVYYFVWRWYWPDAGWVQMHLLVVPWQFGLPLLLPMLLRRSKGQLPARSESSLS
jgi:hypothetical protein